MPINRRRFLAYLGAGSLTTACGHISFDDGLWNPCFPNGLPEHLRNHPLVRSAFDGLDMHQVWDCHAHLVGTGDSDSGIWVNPNMQSWLHPIQHVQWIFYMNATCLEQASSRDAEFVVRMAKLCRELPAGFQVMLLAFDYKYDTAGNPDLDNSSFHIPNDYAAQVAAQHPQHFQWIASIHPYRKDCITALDKAVAQGARAVKWLPPAMGIDPASPRCDAFYEALLKHNIPLLTHAGEEKAVAAGEGTEFGNPLALRRPLDKGVKVIVAHCGSLGESTDLDKGPDAEKLPSFQLFSRLMDESRYQHNLFADISALTQVNRVDSALATVIRRQDWHQRLINGSDYPLPGVVPIISTEKLVKGGFITADQASVFSEIRGYNPLLFDLVVKRHLRYQGKALHPVVFESRRLFQPPAASV